MGVSEKNPAEDLTPKIVVIMQKIELIGNLGSDANVEKKAERGFVAFRLAVTRSRRNATGELEKRTECYTVNAYIYDSVVPYLKKGARVFLRGELFTSVYADKLGYPQVSLDVITRELELV